MLFSLSDVLLRSGLELDQVNVMLHSPRSREGHLLRMLPGLVRTRRSAMEVYQAFHSEPAERALSRGRPWVASFVKTGAGKAPGSSAMLFAGLYRNHGGRAVPRAEIASDPDVDWLHREFGVFQELTDPDWTHWTRFDLRLDPLLAELQGRLIVELRLTPTYVRLAERLDAPVLAITAESSFDAAPPCWRDICLTAGMLRALPHAWEAQLQAMPGIYLIVDQSDGARYVGAAYGEQNLLGRWRAHAAGDEGVTEGLARRDPRMFRFSILEPMALGMSKDEIILREQTWMKRLDTVRFGLNRPRDQEANT